MIGVICVSVLDYRLFLNYLHATQLGEKRFIMLDSPERLVGREFVALLRTPQSKNSETHDNLFKSALKRLI